jgi:hypothetical protein
MKTLYIVPCGKKKIWAKHPFGGPVQAKDVYIGPSARKCQLYAQRFYPEDYCILSAKFGFLWPDDTVPVNYDVSFAKPRTSPITIEELKKCALEKGLFGYDKIVIVAARIYAEIAAQVFHGKEIHRPLAKCLNMFEMIKLLDKAIRYGISL